MQLSKFQTAHILLKSSSIISLFPLARIWSDSGNTWCYFNGVWQGKCRDTFSFQLLNRREWGDWNSHGWHPPVLTRIHMCEDQVLTTKVSFKLFFSLFCHRAKNLPTWSTDQKHAGFLCACVHVQPPSDSCQKFTNLWRQGAKKYEGSFHTQLLVCLRK